MMRSHKLIYCLMFFICTSFIISSEDILPAWVNSIRERQGLSMLSEDHLLTRTAMNYCKELNTFGRLSHKDQYGNNALERYRRIKGTAVSVGEILGAGNNEEKILLSWMESQSHRDVILHKDWTHYGMGIYAAQDWEIIVMLFARNLVPDLVIVKTSSGIEISGHIVISGISQVIIKDNTRIIQPDSYNRDEGFFQFILSPEKITPCLKLGYLNKIQFFIITNVIYPFKY